MAQDVKIFSNTVQIFEHIPWASQITDVFSWLDLSSLGQKLLTEFPTIVCIIIIGFVIITEIRCIFSWYLPLTFNISATLAVSVLTIKSDALAS